MIRAAVPGDDYVANRMVIHTGCTVYSDRSGDFARLPMFWIDWLAFRHHSNLATGFLAFFCGKQTIVSQIKLGFGQGEFENSHLFEAHLMCGGNIVG